ncbi:hypothetical protein MMC34_003155 [Xylographa carneopallida]|nr:hypothetical protein [Xylographa carneopallida]
MKSLTILVPLTILLSACAQATYLPECSNTDIEPCACPNGTEFQDSHTYAVVGTNVKNFKKLFSSCNATRNSTSSVPLANSIYNCLVYNVGWLSANLTATDGPDNHVGSKRTIESGSAVGTYEFVEEEIEFTTYPDGGFKQRFILAKPIEYQSGNGSFAGYWVTLEARYLTDVETTILWGAYACFTGHPLALSTFRAGALAGAEATLKQKGLLTGINVAPVSLQSF